MVRLIPDHECLKCYNGGDWTVNLGGIPVRWFSASWNLSERKQQEKFQAVMYNLPEDITDASLFPNGRSHQFLLSWCRYSIPNFKNLHRSARIGNAEKSFRTPNGSNFSFSGLNTNNRKNDYNKTPKSGRSTKKIDHSRNDQSKKPNVKHLITGLKALLEHYV
ncbi:hypothetical protein RclHR1_03720013 [Rhizophagus clarus]|uniref:Uncharacterized protein n=1 Tax=Rhizophagus clarus TaxID=94130 RepID=A0A2Z6RU02_9GLOM|nr:hypothetical protein RclHR1_03720013 [Rhizophagus clarus]